MAKSSSRAEITTRSRGAEAWDAGLHAQVDAGPIDLGLAVERTQVGLVLDAPGVGRLKVALDVAADGSAKALALLLTLPDGSEAPIAAPDEARTVQLTFDLDRATAQLKELTDSLDRAATERDEARAHAAGLATELNQELAAVTGRLGSTETELGLEKQAHLEASAERDRLRSELERAQRTSLEGQDAVRAENARLELERESLHVAAEQRVADARAEGSTKLAASQDALASEQRAHAETKAHLEASQGLIADAMAQRDGAVAERASQTLAHQETSSELSRLRAAQEKLEAELKQSRARSQKLESELRAAQQLRSQQQNQADAAAKLEAELGDLRAQQSALTDERTQLNARLKTEQGATEEAREVARQLKLQLDNSSADRDEARAVARQLHTRLASTSEAAKAEKDRLDLQVEQLTRQLEQERSLRAKAVAARDAATERLGARAAVQPAPAASPSDFFHAPTKPYDLDHHQSPTMPELAVVGPQVEEPTDPLLPGHKKKAP